MTMAMMNHMPMTGASSAAAFSSALRLILDTALLVVSFLFVLSGLLVRIIKIPAWAKP